MARASIRVLNVLYVNVNEAPTINRLRPVHDAPGAALRPGRSSDARSTTARARPATAPRARARRRTPRRSST